MTIGPFEITIQRLKKTIDATNLHPELKAPIEKAFKIGKIQYWGFKNIMDMPTKRHNRMSEFLREADMRMTRQDLMECLNLQKKAVNKGDLTSVIKIIDAMEYSVNQFIETDSFYRIFSSVYFTIDEDLSDYDDDFNNAKIELFKKEPLEDFFFKKPIRKYMPDLDISNEDLNIFLKQTKSRKQYLDQIKSAVSKETAETGISSGGE